MTHDQTPNPVQHAAPERVAVVVKGYPRLSETFIAQELLGLQQAGLDFEIYSLRQPYDPDIHPVHREIKVPVHYLPEYLHNAPGRVLRGIWCTLRRAGPARVGRVLTVWLRDLRRDFTANRVRRLGQAFVLATELPTRTTWIYAHFLHTPASVARYAALLCGLPWSCSAHAKDIYTTPGWEISEKLAGLEWLVTCTAANVAHLRDVAPASSEKVHLLYHGLDFSRFPSGPARGALTAAGGRPVTILSVGRAVPKKGYRDVLEALAALPDNLDWRFIHIGGGADHRSLVAQAERLEITGRIEWRGAQPQAEVIAAYRNADMFVLASRIADDGDRDGLPNVLMEAQSQGVACIATSVSAIPELIEDGATGLLIPPNDSDALRDAIVTLAGDTGLRNRLGAAGANRVRARFDHEPGIAMLARRFGIGQAATAVPPHREAVGA